MKTLKTSTLLLIGGISLFSLSGCEQAEQAANDAIEKTRQSAAQVLDNATQNGSIDKAKESASQVLGDVRQKAAGLLGQASEFLAKDPQKQDIDILADDAAAEANSDSPTAL